MTSLHLSVGMQTIRYVLSVAAMIRCLICSISAQAIRLHITNPVPLLQQSICSEPKELRASNQMHPARHFLAHALSVVLRTLSSLSTLFHAAIRSATTVFAQIAKQIFTSHAPHAIRRLQQCKDGNLSFSSDDMRTNAIHCVMFACNSRLAFSAWTRSFDCQ